MARDYDEPCGQDCGKQDKQQLSRHSAAECEAGEATRGSDPGGIISGVVAFEDADTHGQ